MSCSTVVDSGTPSPEFAAETWSTIEVRYHGVAEHPALTVRGEKIVSPEFTCFGRQWSLILLPGGTDGDGEGRSDDGMVGLFLRNLSRETANIRFGFGLRNLDGKEVEYRHSSGARKIHGRGAVISARKRSRGFKNFIERSTMLTCIVKGALVIDVKLKLAEPTNQPPHPFVATNPFCSTMLKLLMDEESADIAFEVGVQGGKRKGNKKKRAKTATSNQTFYAHSLILKSCASQLAEMCGSGEKDEPVPIIDVKPDVFGHLLHYIYGGKVPEDDMKAHAREIIDAADKYGISNLKLEAEACYVNSTTITWENVMDNLVYADSKNCALLKEVVMDFMVENKFEVLQKVSFDDGPCSPTIIKDIFAAVARGDTKGGSDNCGPNKYSTMRIGDLRRKAHERGLNIDGSREALIAALGNDATPEQATPGNNITSENLIISETM